MPDDAVPNGNAAPEGEHKDVMLSLATFEDMINELRHRHVTYAFLYFEEEGQDSGGYSSAFGVAEETAISLVGAMEALKFDIIASGHAMGDDGCDDDVDYDDENDDKM